MHRPEACQDRPDGSACDQDRSKAELHISKDSHNFQKIHLSFVGVNFREVIKASPDITHVNLMYFAPAPQVFDDRENFRGRLS